MFIVTYGLGGIIASAITRKLGGLTGDIYGALNEIIEVSLLLVLVGCTIFYLVEIQPKLLCRSIGSG